MDWGLTEPTPQLLVLFVQLNPQETPDHFSTPLDCHTPVEHLTTPSPHHWANARVNTHTHTNTQHIYTHSSPLHSYLLLSPPFSHKHTLCTLSCIDSLFLVFFLLSSINLQKQSLTLICCCCTCWKTKCDNRREQIRETWNGAIFIACWISHGTDIKKIQLSANENSKFLDKTCTTYSYILFIINSNQLQHGWSKLSIWSAQH